MVAFFTRCRLALERENADDHDLPSRPGRHIRRGLRLGAPSGWDKAPVYLSQNDGTLMSVDYAERYPVATFASGPTNSMRGAAFSVRRSTARGGHRRTTSGVGVLQQGFPREASSRSRSTGEDILPHAGRAVVRLVEGAWYGSVTSSGSARHVGYELTSKALIFGGDTLTATTSPSQRQGGDCDRRAVRHSNATWLKPRGANRGCIKPGGG